MRNLREQFSSGSFSLSGSSTNRDVAEWYKFLKGDYYVGEPRRCKLISHLGHQEHNRWYISEKVELVNGRLVPEDRRIYLCQNDELRWLGTDIEESILTCTNRFHVALKRYLDLTAKAYGDNAAAFIAATSFVVWRICSSPMPFNGEANIGLIHSTARSVGKTTCLQVLAFGQGCQRKDHPLLVSLGDQCVSGTSLKMVMNKVCKTTLVTFLDDGKMTSALAEFLLQLQGGLMQGSTAQGQSIPKGSVILTSNFNEPERLVGRVIKFPFKDSGGFSRDVEQGIKELLAHVQSNKGLLTLWAVKYNSLVMEAEDAGISLELTSLLAQKLPNYQSRWLKGVARVILVQTLLYLTTGHPVNLVDVVRQYLHFQDTMQGFQTTLQKIQSALFYQIKANPSKSQVLSWLNPSTSVNKGADRGEKKFVPAIAIRSTITDQWSDVSRQELLDEAQKHGKSTTGVSVAFGKGDDVCTGDLIKRNQNSEMKKAVKLSKRELNPNLVSLIEKVTSGDMTEEELDAVIEASPVPTELQVTSAHSQDMGADTVDQIVELSAKLEKLVKDGVHEKELASNSGDFSPELMRTLDGMSPDTKRKAEAHTPRRKKVFLQGYALGVSKQINASDEDEPSEVNKPSCSSSPHPQVAGTIGVFQKRKTVEDSDDSKCIVCNEEDPPGKGKTKDVLWVQCDKCDCWFHGQCAGVRKAPKGDWLCTTCKEKCDK